MNSVSFSPDDRLVAAGLDDHAVRIWAVQTGEHVETLTGHQMPVRSISFTPEGRSLVSGSDDRTVKIWDISALFNSAVAHELKPSSTPTQSDGESRCPCILTLEGHSKPVSSVAVSSNGRWIVSGSEDHTMQFWNRETGELQRVIEAHQDEGMLYFSFAD